MTPKPTSAGARRKVVSAWPGASTDAGKGAEHMVNCVLRLVIAIWRSQRWPCRGSASPTMPKAGLDGFHGGWPRVRLRLRSLRGRVSLGPRQDRIDRGEPALAWGAAMPVGTSGHSVGLPGRAALRKNSSHRSELGSSNCRLVRKLLGWIRGEPRTPSTMASAIR